MIPNPLAVVGGVVAGGLLGGFASLAFKDPPTKVGLVVGAGVLGGLVGGAGAAMAESASSAAVTLSPSIVALPNPGTGATLTLSLPPGATWVSLTYGSAGSMIDGSPQQGLSTPLVLTIPPSMLPTTFSAEWALGGATLAGAVIVVPAGASLTTAITDPATVISAKNFLNALVAQKLGIPGLQPVVVDGNPTAIDFVAALTFLQAFILAQSTTLTWFSSWYSANISPGRFDYATYALMSLPL